LTSVTTLAPNDFTHLHVHSEFSLLDGLGRIATWWTEAERLGFDALALTDHGALYARSRSTGGAREGDQADHRRGDLRRPPLDARQGGKADAQPFHLCSSRRTSSATATCAGS